jgi:hypothetical protein
MRLHSKSYHKLYKNVYLEKIFSVVQYIVMSQTDLPVLKHIMMAEINDFGQHNLDLTVIKFCTVLAIICHT